MDSCLLDTHVWIWLINGDSSLKKKSLDVITAASRRGRVYVSVISVWEVAMLVSKGRLLLEKPLQQWCLEALGAPGIQVQLLTPDIAIESCVLPGPFHGDPADRMIVATARLKNTTIITRDARILNYGKKGYIKTLAC